MKETLIIILVGLGLLVLAIIGAVFVLVVTVVNGAFTLLALLVVLVAGPRRVKQDWSIAVDPKTGKVISATPLYPLNASELARAKRYPGHYKNDPRNGYQPGWEPGGVHHQPKSDGSILSAALHLQSKGNTLDPNLWTLDNCPPGRVPSTQKRGK